MSAPWLRRRSCVPGGLVGRNEEEIEMRDSAQDLAQALARFFNSHWTKAQV